MLTLLPRLVHLKHLYAHLAACPLPSRSWLLLASLALSLLSGGADPPPSPCTLKTLICSLIPSPPAPCTLICSLTCFYTLSSRAMYTYMLTHLLVASSLHHTSAVMALCSCLWQPSTAELQGDWWSTSECGPSCRWPISLLLAAISSAGLSHYY